MFVERSACFVGGDDEHAGEVGDPATCLIIPNALFYDMYVFSTPDTTRTKSTHYMTLVIEEPYLDILRFDDQPIQLDENIPWKYVFGMMAWKVGSVKVTSGTHSLQGIRLFYFGCYLYGYNQGYGYMHPAGFMASSIDVDTCEVTNADMVRGDIIDNDCDGRVDEEYLDGWDNDHDGYIDEDLAKPNRVNGGWQAWRAWTCTQNCKSTDMERVRRCVNPRPVNFGSNCLGKENETKSSNCWVRKRCPTTCPKMSYGAECAHTCSNCVNDCNKFNGSCLKRCIPGYQDLEEGCTTPCSSGWYGDQCKLSCEEKCGGECADPVEGDCPIRYWLILMIVVTVLGVVGGGYYYWRWRQEYRGSGSSMFTYA
ncbi:uncharacterized protein LOC131929932 [Physella acuta]|uniref:uncharacterized protein LOC131929932 n=1 Tax=Physella acuta TaxID=109671 RepID=UPI0027DBCAE2|nr:uncharacterized protein LOC131929932 [Physella acuta]